MCHLCSGLMKRRQVQHRQKINLGEVYDKIHDEDFDLNDYIDGDRGFLKTTVF